MNNDRKRLIEVSLPLAEISRQSAREKSIRHGHISTLHIWWARRPLAAMRAAIFASLIPAPDSDEERERLEKLIATIVDWDQVKDGNSEAILKARELIRQAFPDRPPRVLDMFAGGGSIPLEALRLGCEAHALELNPVAYLILLCTLVYPQKYGQPEKRIVRQGEMEVEAEVNPLAEDVRKWGEWVLERAREEIGHLYENPVGDETIAGYLWAWTVQCPNPACRAEMPLVRQWWLAKTSRRKIALKPVVDRDARRITFEVVNLGSRRGGSDGFDPSRGTSSRSAGTCLVCGQVADKEYVKGEGVAGRMGQRLLAVIYEQAGAGKGYRPATAADEALFEQAQVALQSLDPDGEMIPNELIPSGSSRAIFVHLYGLTRWGDLSNARQLLALLTFSRQVRAAYDAMRAEGMDPGRAKAIATYLAIIVDRIADYSSSLTRWRNTVEAIAGMFERQALPMVWDYVEINPTGETSGWSASVEWVAQVIEHTAYASDQPATAQQGTATRLPYPDDHFDAVITDPPYYDAVPYADLSDFFYVWLKRSIGFLYPDLFSTDLSPKSEEIIQKPSDTGNETEISGFYERELTKAFLEARRVLAPNGTLVVVFDYRAYASLELLINTLAKVGLSATASWPLPAHHRLHGIDISRPSFPVLVVCRKQVSESQGADYWHVRAQVRARVREFLNRRSTEDLEAEYSFISAIGPALEVFSQYRPVVKADGEHASVSELLEIVQQEVADFILVQELLGDQGARK